MEESLASAGPGLSKWTERGLKQTASPLDTQATTNNDYPYSAGSATVTRFKLLYLPAVNDYRARSTPVALVNLSAIKKRESRVLLQAWLQFFCWIITNDNERLLRCGQDEIRRRTLLSINHVNSRRHQQNKPSVISNSIIVTCGTDGCGGVMLRLPTHRRINPGQLWMLHTTGTVKANKPFHTSPLPWKLTTPRVSFSIPPPSFFHLSMWKLNVRISHCLSHLCYWSKSLIIIN